MIIALALIASATEDLSGSSVRLVETWTSPAQMPIERVHGIAKVGAQTYIGGLRGLWRLRDGTWDRIDDRPVREIAFGDDGKVVWVLYGDGSVDKLEPGTNRLFYDVMHGVAKRPWVSCLGSGGRIGGLGGWLERSDALTENYPEAMKGDVVTAICAQGSVLWLGSQKHGLFRWSGGKLDRFGFAAGLPDSWVTGLTFSGGKLFIGVADGGLLTFANEKLTSLDTPCRRVRKLVTYRDRVVVGGFDGAWIQDGRSWQQLDKSETTVLSMIDGRLAVGNPTSVSWWK